MVELADRYALTSNRESGFGRYDVMLKPRAGADGMVLELLDMANKALDQIEQRRYEEILVEKGIPKDQIRKYGFAFCGKKALIASR